jgi:6-pyruvoyl-tetrahydropterin synthase
MVVDFTELKTIKDYVMTNWDHALIMSKHDPDVKIFEKLMREKNIVKLALVDDKNVTAENMAKLLALVLYEDIKVKIPESMLGNIKVSIWETRTNKATYTLK